MKVIRGSYSERDCRFLLTDLTDQIKPIPSGSLDTFIAQGHHYSECITEEAPVSDEVNKIFDEILQSNAKVVAMGVQALAQAIKRKYTKPVLVSLARAGTPIGVLLKRYFDKYYPEDNVMHYSVSIIRDIGIDTVALDVVHANHPDRTMIFVDGWTGRGSIRNELHKTLTEYNAKAGTDIKPILAVVADPAKVADIYGTREDICIPNACLNSTVSGLVSRTIYNKERTEQGEYHGAICYRQLAFQDKSGEFIEAIEEHFTAEEIKMDCQAPDMNYVKSVLTRLIERYGEPDITRYKLSIGETSRALIRRDPKAILVRDKEDPQLKFIMHLAKRRSIPVEEYDTADYKCIAVLKSKKEILEDIK